MHGFVAFGCVLRVTTVLLVVSGFASVVLGQHSSGGCPSEVRVPAGSSTVVDCVPGADFRGKRYRWTSPDPSWLEYLSDAAAASPRFHAPVDAEMPYHVAYRRLVFDEEGAVVDRGLVSIIVHRADGGAKRSRASEVPAGMGAEVGELAAAYESVPVAREAPFLRCVPRTTVSSGEMAEIPCTALHATEKLLAYRVAFDWPPYSETRLLGAGTFDYLVRVPVIDGPASVRMLEIFAQVPGGEQEVSARVEVHIVNRTPTLTCENLIVEEAVEAAIPCSVTSERPVRMQVLSDRGPRGIHDHWPSLVIPEVDQDTSFSVTVRVFDATRVEEEEFMVKVRNTSDPMELRIECDPPQREVYEGAPAFRITCKTISGPTAELSWTWSAEGETPIEALELDLTGNDFRTATFHVPEEVTQDTFYEYTVTATHDDEGASNRVSIFITVLEKPDIAVVCEEPASPRTGDPPLQLVCTASNSKGLPLTYRWSWTPISPTPIGLLSDPAAATPRFEVPTDQTELVQAYVYEVTASAEFADPPEVPTRLTVTVFRNLGPLGLVCGSPVEVYAGSPEVQLDCSVPDPVPPDIAWSWQLVGGGEDLLVQGTDGVPPIFRTPASVARATTWTYLLQVDAPPHYETSEPQTVEITVRKRPVLSLECPREVAFTVGQSPQPIACRVTNDQELDLAYTWRWTPPTRLSDPAVATPLFEVPLHQRAISRTYPYTVTVQADHAAPVEAFVEVTVLNPAALPSEVMEVTTSRLELGVVGPQGQVVLDPTTAQVSGQHYAGAPHAGRMMLQAQDSVTLSLEQLSSVVLHHAEEDRVLTLMPQWSYSESCVQFSANIQTSQIVQARLEPGDCHVLRIGGTASLEGAVPGTYSGEAAIVLTLNEVEELYTIPVTLTVEAARQVVVLGPSGARIQSAPNAALYGEERVHIWPQVAVFGPETRHMTFELHNPSPYPMEVEASTTYGYREHRDTGSVLVTDPGSGPGDLATALSVYPGMVVLLPGETKQVQAAITEPVEERGHAGMFNFTVTPRSYIDQRRTPAPAGPARITFQAPGVYVPDRSPEPLRAHLESRTEEALIVVFETDTVPFYGQVLVLEDSGRELGRADLLVVTRSRVPIALEASPQEPFRLKFVPYPPNQSTPADVHFSADL